LRASPPDDLPENLRLGQRLISGEIDSFKYEKRYYHKQGRLIWALLSASLVRDDYGHPLYIISQIQDITERKQAKRRSASSANWPKPCAMPPGPELHPHLDSCSIGFYTAPAASCRTTWARFC